LLNHATNHTQTRYPQAEKNIVKAEKTYLKGKSVFIVSLLVIGITILTVYL